jgi:DNA-binding transcriptional LysR family regulator
VDIQLFRTFLLVAKLGSITHAAEQLNFTQPAITAQIRTLEGHFGVSLFDRVGKKRVLINSAGQDLVAYAERLLAVYDEMHVSLQPQSSRAEPIKIGSSTDMASYVLPSVLREFQCRTIKGIISVDIRTFLSDTVKALLDNTFDLIIVNSKISNEQLMQFSLFQERLVWVAQRELVAGSGGCIDIASYPFINFRPGSVYRSKYEEILKEMKVNPSLEYSDASSILRAVLDGLGIGVLPYVLVAPFLANGTLIEFVNAPQLHVVISLAFHKNKVLSPAMRALLSIFGEKANLESGIAEYLESMRG